MRWGKRRRLTWGGGTDLGLPEDCQIGFQRIGLEYIAQGGFDHGAGYIWDQVQRGHAAQHRRVLHPWIRQAVEALGTIGPDARAAAPVLGASLDDARLQVVTIAAVGRVGGADERTLTRMVALLKHSDPDVRGVAASALGRLGTSAISARPVLRTLAEGDPKDFVRLSAREALRRLGSVR